MTGAETWSDDPIASEAEDRFGRARFAALVASAIDQLSINSRSTVFGLVGTWGSGKSSVAAMVAGQLPKSWVVRSFTPWAAGGAQALQLEFVAALDSALDGSRAKDKKAREAWGKYIKRARPILTSVPFVGSALGGVADVVGGELAIPKPWATEFTAISAALSELGKRILIVCDDIDRLDATELLEFLKVVRLLGRFPNVHYLVAYDADTVEDLLASEGVGGRATSFMEKIVQHPFELPQLDRAARWDRILAGLNRAIVEQSVALDDANTDRLRDLLDALAKGLRTPRQIGRFEQHLSALARMVPGEVDLLDFAAVAYLRLNHHEIYSELATWADDLRAGVKPVGDDKSSAPTKEEWLRRIRETSRRTDIAGAWETIEFLFPTLRDSAAVLHKQAFADYLYTERYYSLGVASNDVSDVLVDAAMASLLGRDSPGKPELELARIIDGSHASIARLAVEKSINHLRMLRGDNQAGPSLVNYVRSRWEIQAPTAGEPNSPASKLFEWFANEVLRAYSSGELDRTQILDAYGEETALSLLLNMGTPYGSRGDSRVRAVLDDFADHFLDQLQDPNVQLEPYEHLRLKLSLLYRAKDIESLNGILDGRVVGQPSVFERVAISMVRTRHWFNGVDSRAELEFDREMWQLVISETLRNELAAELTPEFDRVTFDELDTTDENRRRIGIGFARADIVASDSPGS